MYTLYYYNKNMQIHFLQVESLDEPINIPEDLVFCNLRKGINFIKEPHQCIGFTDIERLIMSTEFYHSELLKESDFRRQNSTLTSLCLIDFIQLQNVTFETIEGFRFVFDLIQDDLNYDMYVAETMESSFVKLDTVFSDISGDRIYFGSSTYYKKAYLLNNVTGVRSQIIITPVEWEELV